MAVNVSCGDPQRLLNQIKAAARKKSLETWVLDSDGDFTHSRQQWQSKAWFRPRVEVGNLAFYILGPKGVRMSREVYAVYHGRFIEMLLTHFDEKFYSATATALPMVGDAVGDEGEE
jgi:hypothetical protein